jgi:hypothetical protein
MLDEQEHVLGPSGTALLDQPRLQIEPFPVASQARPPDVDRSHGRH